MIPVLLYPNFYSCRAPLHDDSTFVFYPQRPRHFFASWFGLLRLENYQYFSLANDPPFKLSAGQTGPFR
jgi:hypothetical protein